MADLEFVSELQDVHQMILLLDNQSKLVRRNGLNLILDICKNNNNAELCQDLLNLILNPICQTISDESEACREISLQIISNIVYGVKKVDSVMPVIISAVQNRIAGEKMVERSEEIRCMIFQLVKLLVERCEQKASFFQCKEIIVSMLSRSLADPFHEVQILSCQCASLVVKFYDSSDDGCYSELLLKPLLASMSHRQAKVRSSSVYAIGTPCRFVGFMRFIS